MSYGWGEGHSTYLDDVIVEFLEHKHASAVRAEEPEAHSVVVTALPVFGYDPHIIRLIQYQ